MKIMKETRESKLSVKFLTRDLLLVSLYVTLESELIY